MNRRTKKMWHLVILLAVDLAMLVLIASICTAKTQAVFLGCNGERVAAIQRKLTESNLYNGLCDGEYCIETRSAVKKIQQKNGIQSSGETDFETLCAMGITSRTAPCFTSEVELLARCIQQSNCQTYPQMLEKGMEILTATKTSKTLGQYISSSFPDFLRNSDEPSSLAYTAALQATRLFLQQTDRLF